MSKDASIELDSVPLLADQGRSQLLVSPPERYWLVFLAFVSVIICYADRSNFSVAVISMTEQYGWDKPQEGFLLGAFFYGYIVSQVPGGWLASKFGGKPVLAAGVTLWSLFTAATVLAAPLGTAPLFACRVLMGLGEGVAFPTIHALIADYVPTSQQSTAVAVVTAASYLGTVLALSVSPAIIEWSGWEGVFVVFGAMGFAWLPFWWWLAPARRGDAPSVATPVPASNPASGKPSELKSPTEETQSESDNSESEDLIGHEGSLGGGVPWRALIGRKEVWAIVANQYCASWGFYVLLSWLPTYFNDVYKLDLAQLPLFTVAPYAAQGVVGLLSGVAADQLIARGVPILSTRRLMQISGMLGPALFLMLASYQANTATEGAAYITAALATSALTLAGVSVSQLDIAPKYAGVVFGMGNTAGQLAGIIAVPLTGLILSSTSSWDLIFALGAAHYLVGALLWYLWGGSKVVVP